MPTCYNVIFLHLADNVFSVTDNLRNSSSYGKNLGSSVPSMSQAQHHTHLEPDNSLLGGLFSNIPDICLLDPSSSPTLSHPKFWQPKLSSDFVPCALAGRGEEENHPVWLPQAFWFRHSWTCVRERRNLTSGSCKSWQPPYEYIYPSVFKGDGF